jgi:hypothetical protein
MLYGVHSIWGGVVISSMYGMQCGMLAWSGKYGS